MKVPYEEVQRQMQELRTETHLFPGTTLTVAIAIAPDNFVLGLGKSACVDPKEFDPGIGATIAIENALKDAENTIWAIEGSKLRDKLKSA